MRTLKWTPALEDQLRLLHKEPLTNTDIGQRLGGFSEYAVRGRAKKLGLGSRANFYQLSEAGRARHREAQRARSRHSAEKILRMRQMWDNGLSYSGIAKAIGGETTSGVAGIARRYGFPQRPVRTDILWSVDEDNALRAGVDEGLTHKEIAMRLPRRSHKAVRNRSSFLGIADTYRVRQEIRFRHRVKRRIEDREKAAAGGKSGDNLIVIHRANKTLAVKPLPPMRSIVCESVKLTPEHTGCRWITSDDRPWMVCANRRAGSRSYCQAHYNLSIWSYEPDEPDDAVPALLEAA